MLPGNANLLIGGLRDANQEIGVPGFQPLRFLPNVSTGVATSGGSNEKFGLEKDQAAADTEGHGFGAAPGPKLAEDRRHVKLDGVLRNVQPRGDFLIA